MCIRDRYNADSANAYCSRSGVSCDPATVALDKAACCVESWRLTEAGLWAQATGRYCVSSDRIADHDTQAEAQAACEADAACLSLFDSGCDGAGDWYTCRSATGGSSTSCLYVKP